MSVRVRSRCDARRMLVLGVIAGLAACQHASPRVEGGAILPMGAHTVEVASHQRLLLPAELGRLSLPPFPSDTALQIGQSLVVCASFTVDEGGAVVDPRPEVFPGETCAAIDAPDVQPYWNVVASTVVGWEYIAAALCTFADGQAAERDPECQQAQTVEAVPVRLAWQFEFTVDQSGQRRTRQTPASSSVED